MVTLDGPDGLAVRAEIDCFEADEPDSACRGVTVEVSVGGEPTGDFAYTVSDAGATRTMDWLEPEHAARVATSVGHDPWTRLTMRDRQ
jgi:hypothetical protein